MVSVDVQKRKRMLAAEYARSKADAVRELARGRHERALRQVAYAACIAWRYPVLESYCDDELEALLSKIAEAVLPGVPERQVPCGDEKRAVFYSGQIVDSGALTEQYLEHLIQCNYRILFIVPKAANTALGTRILKKLTGYRQAYLLVPSEDSVVGRATAIYCAVEQFRPTVAFLHFLPNDVEGFLVFSRFQGLLRYYIVHNDHTFWIGKACADYFIEFRQFGYKLSAERRKIERRRLIYLPFYPINDGVPFQGWPFDAEGKVVGLSGGALYKYLQDPELKYFQVIRRLLQENEGFIFCLAGSGPPDQVDTIRSFIAKSGLDGRFVYLGQRSDYYALVGQADIYVESCPMRGGLSVLFATNQGKAVVGLGRPVDLSGLTEEFFDLEAYHQPQTFESFYEEATRLIRSSDYRAENARLFRDTDFNRRSFEQKLDEVLDAGRDYVEQYVFKMRLSELDDAVALASYLNLGDEMYYVRMMRSQWLSETAISASLSKVAYTLLHLGPRECCRRVFSKLATTVAH